MFGVLFRLWYNTFQKEQFRQVCQYWQCATPLTLLGLLKTFIFWISKRIVFLRFSTKNEERKKWIVYERTGQIFNIDIFFSIYIYMFTVIHLQSVLRKWVLGVITMMCKISSAPNSAKLQQCEYKSRIRIQQ